MRTLLAAVLLTTSVSAEIYLEATPPDESARHQAESELHPERYRTLPGGETHWFMRTPVGERSLHKFDRQHPHAVRGKPSWISEHQQQVRAHNEAVTGRPYRHPWEKYMARQQSDMITELRAEIRRLQRRLEQLEQPVSR